MAVTGQYEIISFSTRQRTLPWQKCWFYVSTELLSSVWVLLDAGG